jgi:LysM repeat protein
MKVLVRNLSVLVVCLFLSLFGVAQEKLPQFLKHKVKPGETMNSIAELYNVNKQDMLLLNDFPEEVFLETNQIILIRQLKDGEEVTALPADYKTGKTTTTTTKAAEPEKKVTATTVVKKEEQVKREEPVNAEEPVVEKKASVPVAVNKAETVGPDGTKYKVAESGYHTVEKGQTFYRIALIYGLSVDELKAINNLSSTTISVGQKLKVTK